MDFSKFDFSFVESLVKPKPYRDVHTEHCCKKHGCKYGADVSCSVMIGYKQSYPCEDCDLETQDFFLYLEGRL
jgi:hypothetical protein